MYFVKVCCVTLWPILSLWVMFDVFPPAGKGIPLPLAIGICMLTPPLSEPTYDGEWNGWSTMGKPEWPGGFLIVYMPFVA